MTYHQGPSTSLTRIDNVTKGSAALGIEASLQTTADKVTVVLSSVSVKATSAVSISPNQLLDGYPKCYLALYRCSMGSYLSNGSASCTGGFSYSKSTGAGSHANGATMATVPVNKTVSFARGHASQTVKFSASATIGQAITIFDDDPEVALAASFSVTIPARPSYAVSYNANGGTGAPAAQTKWYGEALALSSTAPTRSGYRFLGWATSASGGVSYAKGASYTDNAALALYAVWEAVYTISYNANGGSGAPGSQTKYAGSCITLSSAKPTRTAYKFLGWATSPSGEVAHQPGASYTANGSATLYAVWELQWALTVGQLRVRRHSKSGGKWVPDDAGEHALVEGSLEIGGALALCASVSLASKAGDAVSVTGAAPSKAAGKGSETFAFEWGSWLDAVEFSADATHEVTATIRLFEGESPSGAPLATASKTAILTKAEFILDFNVSGEGMGIGTAAPEKGLDVGWDARFGGSTSFEGSAAFEGSTEFKGAASISDKASWRAALGLGAMATVDSPVPVANGGTGATGAAQAVDNLVWHGNNPVTSTGSDTVSVWGSKGFGLSFFNTLNCLNGQPSQWGFLLNLNHKGTNEVHQLWTTQSTGSLFHRGGNNSGLNGWRQVWDSGNCQAMRNAAGLGNTTGALPVANGGTGATTAANAKTNLGLSGYTVTNWITINLSAGSLASGGTKNVSATGTLSSNTQQANFAIRAMAGCTLSGTSHSYNASTHVFSISGLIRNVAQSTMSCAVTVLVLGIRSV